MSLSPGQSDHLNHSPAECDKLLRADPTYSPTRCQPATWRCPGCGRVWQHVCYEAEGCFYAEVGGTV